MIEAGIIALGIGVALYVIALILQGINASSIVGDREPSGFLIFLLVISAGLSRIAFIGGIIVLIIGLVLAYVV